jgi:hypothetical protein
MTMILLNPFKRTRYLLHTSLTIATAGNSLLKGADSFNETVRGRGMLVTLRDEQFTASIEPFSFGQRGTGQWMNRFVIEARGRFLPSHDGSVQVTLGFRRALSAAQVAWRLVFYLLELGAAAEAIWGPVVFVLGLSLAIILAVVGIPWSIVAYFQGMHQATRDWPQLLEVIRSALYSHMVERA